MEYRPTQIERAFALAKSGTFTNLKDIRSKLRAEGYANDGSLTGWALINQLQRLVKAARAKL